jgi:hypothetical protein
VKTHIAIAAILGIVLTAFLILHTGLGSVLSAAVAVGWTGFAILCLYALGQLAVLGTGWSVLLPEPYPGSWRPGLQVFIWARMVRDAATDVLPFSNLGGFVLGARAAILHGVARPVTVASMIVDVTTEMLAQLVFVALGVMILSVHAPRDSFAASVITAFMIGLALAAAGAGLITVAQRHGGWIARKLANRLFPDAAAADAAAAGAAAADAAAAGAAAAGAAAAGAAVAGAAVASMLKEIYRSPWRVGLSLAVHFAGWVVSAVGAWIAFRLMGARVDLVSVLAIESLVCAVRSVAFLVPNAIGVQEGAYALLAPLFGVGAEFALGVSLLKRARDAAVGVPILLIWQGMEGHALARAR